MDVSMNSNNTEVIAMVVECDTEYDDSVIDLNGWGAQPTLLGLCDE